MLFRELLMATVAPHLAHRIMEVLPMAREARFDFCAGTSERARRLQVRIEQLHGLGRDLSTVRLLNLLM